MKSRSTPVVIFCRLYGLILLAACGSTAGSAGAILCGPGGECGGNLVCVNNYCMVPTDKADIGASDAAAGADTAGGQDTIAADADDKADATAPGPDVAPADTVDQPDAAPDVTPVDTAGPDAAGEDIAKPDTAGDTSDLPGGPMTIQQIQSAATSLLCPNENAEVLTAKGVVLEPAVLTGDPGVVSKLQSFFLAPATGPLDPSYQGLQVLVTGGTAALAAGDVVQLTGDVKEYFCMTELMVKAADVKVIGKIGAPTAAPLPLAKLKGTAAEAYEGVLVQIQNVYVAEPNVIGSDGKTHGEFAVGATADFEEVVIGPSSGTSFSFKNNTTGQTESKMKAGQYFASITGHMTYGFGRWVLRPRKDADLVAGAN